MSNPEELSQQLGQLAATVASKLADDGTVVAGEVQAGVEGVQAATGQENFTSVAANLSGGVSGQVILSLSATTLESLGENALDALSATATEIVSAWMADSAPDVVVALASMITPEDAAALAGSAASCGAAPLAQDGNTIGYVACIYSEGTGEASADSVEFDSFDEPTNVHPINARSLELLNEVEMGVSVELGRTRMAVRDLLALTPGTVVELDRAAGSPVDLLVNGTMIAKGEVVVIDEDFGVRITEIVGHDDSQAAV